MLSLLDNVLFGVLPYISLTIFVAGLIYRGKVKPLEWSTRASGFFERSSMGVASLALHWGIITLFIAHVIGLIGGLAMAPTLTRVFYWMGVVAGTSVFYGATVALIRRAMLREMRSMSQVEDYVVLAFLIVIPGIALYQVLVGQLFGLSLTVAPWLASLFKLSPNVQLMSGLTVVTKAHLTLAWLFIAYWPYTKLVHVWALPWRYFYRPYQSIRMYRQIAR